MLDGERRVLRRDDPLQHDRQRRDRPQPRHGLPRERRVELARDEGVEPGPGNAFGEARLSKAEKICHLDPDRQTELVPQVALTIALHGHGHGEADRATSGALGALDELARQPAIAEYIEL